MLLIMQESGQPLKHVQAGLDNMTSLLSRIRLYKFVEESIADPE